MIDATETAAETAAHATDAATGAENEHRIPKYRLDEEVAKRRALEEQVSGMADVMLNQVPETLKALIPTELSPAAQAAWYIKAKETGVFDAKAPATTEAVPTTDETKPTVTPKEPDLSGLPPIARMARAYGKGN